jgi:glycosyltransferase involved in cell wall biosynthesis
LLPAAIRSVLAQTVSDLELLVIDDGSRDDTARVVAAIDDPRLRYVRREHGGIGAALNTGLGIAGGQLVARLDSDDEWQPHMLDVLADALDDPALGFAYGRGRAMNASGRPLPWLVGTPPRYPARLLESLVYDDCTCNIAVLARRDAIDEAGGYDESLLAAEDWDLWLRVAMRRPYRFVDREVARFRYHPGSLTAVSSAQLAEVLDCRVRVLDKLFARADLPHAVHAMRAVAYRNVHVFATIRYLQAGRVADARRAFGRSVAEAGPGAAVRNAAFIALYGYLTRWRAGRLLAEAIARARRRLRGWQGDSASAA